MFAFVKNLADRLFNRTGKPNIHVYAAKLTGGGKLIEIRYRLSHPGKLHSAGKISLTLEGSGTNLSMLRIERFGATKKRRSKNQNSGNALFFNQNGAVKRGSKVTLRLGDLVARGIAVK
jgi:hypothetical protein